MLYYVKQIKLGGQIMAIGKRIRFFRNRKGLTQKELGGQLGFVGSTADVRMAQYETEARVPKQELINTMAQLLDVSSNALTVPDIDTKIGLMHTLFAMEDMFGLKIDKIDGEIHLVFDKDFKQPVFATDDMLHAWLDMSDKLATGKITTEQYNEWRYKYPSLDNSHIKVKVPSIELFDELDKMDKKKSKQNKK